MIFSYQLNKILLKVVRYHKNNGNIDMNRIKQMGLLFVGVVITGPAEAKKSKKQTPCWITAPCDPYLESEYLIGVGSGATIEEADAAAMGAIARQFVVNVSQTQTSVKDLSQTSRATDTISELDHQRLRTETEVQTNTSLEQVQIVEHWERKEKKSTPSTVYSLATVKRSDWLSRIDMERNELSSAQSKLRMTIRKSTTLYEQIPHYRALIPLLDRDVGLYNQRQIVDPQQGSMPPALTAQQLQSEFLQKRGSTAIYIAPTTPYRSSLTNAFSTLDMPTTDTPSSVAIQCQAQQNISEPDNYGFIKANTTLSCTVFNNTQSLYVEDFVGKASSRDADKAKIQSENALETALQPLVDKVDALWSL